MKSLAALLILALAVLLFLRPWEEGAQSPAAVPDQTAPEVERAEPQAPALTVDLEKTRRVEAAVAEPESVDPATPGLLKVRVVNEDGAAVAEARTYAKYVDPDETPSGTQLPQGQTDDLGLCQFEVSPARELVLHAFKIRESSQEQVEVPALAPGEVRELTVVVKTRDDETFVGRVVSEDGGLSLAGVAVHTDHQSGFSFTSGREAHPLPTAGEPAAITDADGLFEVPTRSWSNTLGTFTASGWSPQRANLARGATSEEIPEVRLRRGARLVGRILTEDETALEVQAITRGYLLLEGTNSVMLSGVANVLFRSTVDATGHFVLEDLPSRVPLDFRVVSGHTTRFQLPEPLTLEPDEAREVEWRLQGAGALRGRVVDEGGQPVAGQVVWLLTPRESRPGLLESYNKPAARTASDADGRFAFTDVQPGTWTVGLAPPSRRVRAGAEAYAPLAVAAQVPDDGSDVEVELVVYRDLFVEGVLRGPDGRTVSASVWLHSDESGLSVSSDSEEDGIFRAGPMPPGLYQLMGAAYGVPGLANSEPIEVRAGDSGVEVFLRPGAALSGRVLGLEGAAPNGARVIVSDGDSTLMTSSLRSGGSFEFQGLLPGNYALSVAFDDGRVGRLTGLTLDAGGRLEDLEVELQPGGTLLVYYTGPEDYRQLRVLQDGVLIAADGLRRGTQKRVTVPAGQVDVILGEETRRALITVGEETVVRFEIPE